MKDPSFWFELIRVRPAAWLPGELAYWSFEMPRLEILLLTLATVTYVGAWTLWRAQRSRHR